MLKFDVNKIVNGEFKKVFITDIKDFYFVVLNVAENGLKFEDEDYITLQVEKHFQVSTHPLLLSLEWCSMTKLVKADYRKMMYSNLNRDSEGGEVKYWTFVPREEKTLLASQNNPVCISKELYKNFGSTVVYNNLSLNTFNLENAEYSVNNNIDTLVFINCTFDNNEFLNLNYDQRFVFLNCDFYNIDFEFKKQVNDSVSFIMCSFIGCNMYFNNKTGLREVWFVLNDIDDLRIHNIGDSSWEFKFVILAGNIDKLYFYECNLSYTDFFMRSFIHQNLSDVCFFDNCKIQSMNMRNLNYPSSPFSNPIKSFTYFTIFPKEFMNGIDEFGFKIVSVGEEGKNKKAIAKLLIKGGTERVKIEVAHNDIRRAKKAVVVEIFDFEGNKYKEGRSPIVNKGTVYKEGCEVVAENFESSPFLATGEGIYYHPTLEDLCKKLRFEFKYIAGNTLGSK